MVRAFARLPVLIRPESGADQDAIRSLTARAFAGRSFSDGTEPQSSTGLIMSTRGRCSTMRRILGIATAVLVLMILAGGVVGAAAAPEGQMTWGIHVSLVPTWFDPAETTGIVTPFMLMYAIHDAMVKPLPGNPLAPSLAESWTLSTDGLAYEFVLRNGVRFHNGDPVTAEAVDQYWRKVPQVKRLVFRTIPDPSTRFAALKRGEIDVSYWMTASLGEELRRTPGLTLKPALANNSYWVYFVDQWDPKSPWHDRRVRLAANYAIDRQAINQAETLGYSRMTYSLIPSHFEFFWQPPAIPYDRARAKQLLAEAGYPNAFDAGDFTCDAVHTGIAEPVANDLQAAGFRLKLRPLERASYNKGQVEKTFKNLVLSASAAFGNAPTRLEAFVVAGGAYV